MPRRALLTLSLGAIFALAASACSGSGRAEPPPHPSGSLGPVRPASVDEAVQGLCQVREAVERNAAAELFFDRSHQTLHVIAAAAELRARGAAADLLETMQTVEADLTKATLPTGFHADVGALIEATRAAVDAIGLEAPTCDR